MTNIFVKKTEEAATVLQIWHHILSLKEMSDVFSFKENNTVATHLLSLRVSSRRRKTHVLLWSDKALLLVLWTCGDVEVNPGPTIKRLARSEVLRKFQRCSQTPIVKLIYEISQTEIPKSLYIQGPPGWKKDDEFKNISNLNKGGEEIFNKLILLFKEKWNPLPPEWDVLLKHYQNLKENNSEDSKNALERWMLEIDIVPKLRLYASINGEPSTDIIEAFKAVSQRWQDNYGISKSTCVTTCTFSITSNEATEIPFSSFSKSATNEKEVQPNVTVASHGTNSMLCEPSAKKRSKSDIHDLQREETAHQSYASPNPETEMIQAVKDTEYGKTNRGTGGQPQLDPDLFEHVQHNACNFEKAMTKSKDHQLFAGTHNLKTSNQSQSKRRLPDEEPMLNNYKVPRIQLDICEKEGKNEIENIQLLQLRAEQLTNDMQRKNDAEQSQMVTLDSEKRKSFNESSPDATVLYDMDIFPEEDELDVILNNNVYQEPSDPIILL
ncbi:uncharacterized protein LOC133194359 [Saccostrea echinata]|uniref:uncharacterized protein LOC133194359 n=1 Tax=Saccostrea echinata TaxID=191078 RepID=UPI002A8296A6|nr:uncharacterized protein LOC133194359 [Saccostrea echinata]